MENDSSNTKETCDSEDCHQICHEQISKRRLLSETDLEVFTSLTAELLPIHRKL